MRGSITGLCLALLLVLGSASAQFTGVPLPGQFTEYVPQSDDQAEAIKNKPTAIEVMDAWIGATPAIQQVPIQASMYEPRVDSPIATVGVERMHKYIWFKANEASFFLASHLKLNFYTDSNRPRISPLLIERIVDDIDQCEDGAFARELPPVLEADGKFFTTRIFFIAASCKNRSRVEVILYEASRSGRFRFPNNKQDNLIPLYMRYWLLKDMHDFFHGKSETC